MKFQIRLIVFLTIAACILSANGQALDQGKVVAGAEKAFDKYAKAASASGPGCAVGVSLGGKSVFEKAFGLAEIEHNIPNTPQTYSNRVRSLSNLRRRRLFYCRSTASFLSTILSENSLRNCPIMARR